MKPHYSCRWLIMSAAVMLGSSAPVQLLNPSFAGDKATSKEILAELEAAKDRYRVELQAAQEKVFQAFDKSRKAVKDNSRLAPSAKLKELDRLDSAEQAFREGGILSRANNSVSRASDAFQKEMKSHKKACNEAFDTAADAILQIDRAAAQAIVDSRQEFYEMTGVSFVGEDGAEWRPGTNSNLFASGVIDPRKWVLPNRKNIRVAAGGEIQLKALRIDHEDTILKTSGVGIKMSDAEVHLTLSASKDTVAYVVLGIDGQFPVTSLIADSGTEILAGHQSGNFAAQEMGTGKRKIPYDEFYKMIVKVVNRSTWIDINERMVSGVAHEPQPGEIGIIVRSGAISIKKIEIKERARAPQ